MSYPIAFLFVLVARSFCQDAPVLWLQLSPCPEEQALLTALSEIGQVPSSFFRIISRGSCNVRALTTFYQISTDASGLSLADQKELLSIIDRSSTSPSLYSLGVISSSLSDPTVPTPNPFPNTGLPLPPAPSGGTSDSGNASRPVQGPAGRIQAFHSDEGNRFPAWAIALIILGGVLFIVFIAVVLWRKSKKPSRDKDAVGGAEQIPHFDRGRYLSQPSTPQTQKFL